MIELMDTTAKQCILCGAPDRDLLIERETWKIYKCASCGLGVLDPQVRKDDLPDLYPKEYFADQYDSGVEPDSPEFNHWLKLLDHRVRFFRRIKRKGELLDIGCGNGYFLALCQKRGYDVRGIDISPWAAHYASSKLGLDVITGKAGDLEFSPESLDIVTLWHVLEHMENPLKMVLKVKSWLRKDGILVVEVPNYRGTDAEHEWDKWIGWQIPYHLYHFTPNSLTLLLKKCGFSIIKFKDFHSETVKNTLRKYPFISLMARVIATFYSGHSFAVVARKQAS
jgi:SAM-dependent methyltransferase